MIEWFSKGGMTMWFLLACAVLGLAIIIERLYTIFIKMRVNVRRFTPKLIETIDREGVQAGIELCDSTPSPVAKVLKAGLEKADRGSEVMEDAIVRAGTGELNFLDRGMALLSGLVMVAPFFGFLGTVTGMIGAFAAVAAVGEVEPTVVASGISEALITTQAGLIIAAPLAIVHILLSGRVNGYLRDMERASAELLEFMADKQHCVVK
ncbi:MAG: MotA/TolQ/ExbB proton channel family protein [bacterium]